MITQHIVWNLLVFVTATRSVNFFSDDIDPRDKKYAFFSNEERLVMLQETKEMFHFAYDSYMTHAFPEDELDPIHCKGRGPDTENPSNININDVLGDYILTLVDSLDTLAIMGNTSEFQRAVHLVVENISFEKHSTIQVFEATIRVVGALLSAHLIIADPNQPFGDMHPEGYENDLLHLAHDLASRLLPAFENTATGIPYPRINLKVGVPKMSINETCTAGAGTLILEFGILSHLLNDPVYESVARRALTSLWQLRSNVTGLFGNVINIQTGKWVGVMSGVGAGMDSFFEYMFKSFIMFGEREDMKMFNESYETIKYYMRKGRKTCNEGSGFPPIFVNVNMKTGEVMNNWIDALGAAWPSIQILNGDIEDAICVHAFYYSIWRKYGALPERYNWHLKSPEVLFYPLRPELIESTYHLYQATKNPFYLHVGKDLLQSLQNFTKVQCGFATLHNVINKDHEDRMESFFLSETCKYLYLLFDTENHINQESSGYLFSTEGHLFMIDKKYRYKPWDDLLAPGSRDSPKSDVSVMSDTINAKTDRNHSDNCLRLPAEKQFKLPLHSRYLRQMESFVGLGVL